MNFSAAQEAPRTITMIGRLVGPAAGVSARDHARAVVLGWTFDKFSKLKALAGPWSEDIALELEGIFLESVAEEVDGDTSWRFSLKHPEPRMNREWQTEVRLATMEGLCTLMVRNSYCGGTEAPQVTQPRFFTPLVKEFQWIDAGIEVSDKVLGVQRRDQLGGFCQHLLSEYRGLPLVVMAPNERESDAPFPFATNPQALATKMCGLAHVVVLSRATAEALRQEFGETYEVPFGGTRVFYPHADPGHLDRQTLFFEQAGGLLAALMRACYAWSASPARSREFDWLGG